MLLGNIQILYYRINMQRIRKLFSHSHHAVFVQVHTIFVSGQFKTLSGPVCQQRFAFSKTEIAFDLTPRLAEECVIVSLCV